MFERTEYKIGAYLRISQEDGRDESCSITNQRAVVRNYIAAQSCFGGSEIREYIDDGISGSHTDRKAYRRLMNDVELGNVNCIAVKDLSRIGRNLIDVDDLLMNYLASLQIRFIAVNNGYDSLTHPLSNLELSIISLANQYYNRDLAVKSQTAKLVKMKRGEFLSCWAFFGYRKSETEKNKIIIDDEAAEYVRLIFSLAIAGNGPTKIAVILNERGVPTPAEYKKLHGVIGGWRTADPKYSFWNVQMVRKVLCDVRYTGTALNNVYQTKESGKRGVVVRPKDERIAVPEAHEAIVTAEQFEAAHEGSKRKKWRTVPHDNVFNGKVRCPDCGRTMTRTDRFNPRFRCTTRHYTEHYGCRDVMVLQAELEAVVLESLRKYAAAMVEQEELKLTAIRQSKRSRAELECKLKTEERAVKSLEESVTKHFTAFVSGKLSQDEFLSKKEQINLLIARKNETIAELRVQLEVIASGKAEVEARLAEFAPLIEIEKLDREIIELTVDKIIVHGEHDVEIVWNGSFGNR